MKRKKKQQQDKTKQNKKKKTTKKKKEKEEQKQHTINIIRGRDIATAEKRITAGPEMKYMQKEERKNTLHAAHYWYV